ncbi:MAG: FAD-binding protein [Proteobacteria bacterium]|nr:FAD-binding protein [Pseudomonadota bacterium]
MLSDNIYAALETVVGAENITASKEDLLCYSYDATNTTFMPDAVVFPVTAVEVSRIVELANREGFSIIPRGAGSGFTGGSLAIAGGVVLSTERMKQTLDIDEENLTATVEPGVITWEFQQDVEAVGLFYPPDPTSKKISTIGGNIAECAGGPRAVKYGVTRDYVLALEVVLPTGEIIKTGTSTMKGVVGYDLTRLMTGSEGTLGIITKATLRLIPKPQSVITMLVSFADIGAAAVAVADIVAARIQPSTLEIIDAFSIKCIEEYDPERLGGAGALLIIEVDGTEESASHEAARVREVCMAVGATGLETATGKQDVKTLWKARRSISPALFKLKPNKINEDVVVPRSKIMELMTGLEALGKSHDLIIACFGHAGDGNIHMNIMYDKTDAAEAARAEEAVNEAFELTLSLGGTISGEHGVGTTKAKYLDMELGPVEIALMRTLKETLDPKGILNPGKIFMDETVAEGSTAPNTNA